jgi:transposase
MTRILAIDLGKFKSVACDYDTQTQTHTFTTLRTTPAAVHDLIVERSPDRVVIEVGSQAGWVKDLCEALGVGVEVANPNHEPWRWQHVKRKTDKDDALKLAQLSAWGRLPTVRLPDAKTRQWRALIEYRGTLVGRRTTIKNGIRAILDRQGLGMPAGKNGWTNKALSALGLEARPLETVAAEDLWRGQLHVELQALEQVEALIGRVESRLEAVAQADERVQRVQSIPGVGRCLAEALVAVIDDPKRFKNRKQVGAYVGLVPRLFESGTMSRHGKITGRGNKRLRALLVQVAWLIRRHNPHLRAIFDRVCRDSKTRRKTAVVATARRLLVIAWALLRDGTTWRDPAASPA